MTNLVIDIGNTDVFAGAYSEHTWTCTHRMVTKTPAEVFLQHFKDLDAKNVMIASVVADKNNSYEKAIKELFNIKPLFCEPKFAYDFITFDVDDENSVGQDRIADCVGASQVYGAPCIIVDFGTATNIEIVDENDTFCGGILMPGIRSGMMGLATYASKLSNVEIEEPSELIGKNTRDCLQSGLIFGEACKIDGLINLIMFKKFKRNQKVNVIATGGFCSKVAKHCKNVTIVDEMLTLKGLKIILDKMVS